MEFALLGPLEVRRGPELVPIRRGRPRTVLTTLLLSGPRAVPADVLVDHAWGDNPPADPANALQVQVSYLRRTLGLPASGPAPALRTVAGAYLLDVDRSAVDVHRFEDAVGAAAAELDEATPDAARRALDRLEAALALWRGEPLQDVVDVPAFAADVARLRELRAAAEEHEIDARLLLGDHDVAVPRLHAMIAEHPLRERRHAQLVLALYRCGRQADALRAYDAARARLVEELGIEPGAELRDLHARVLAQDPSLSPPDAVGQPSRPPRLPASTTTLVGREREIEAVVDALARSRMVTLTGPAGAGKTRLALAAAHAEGGRRPVWLVELAHVDDPAVVPFELARAAGVSAVNDPVDALACRFGDGSDLLVLDTCEHVADACAACIDRLLRDCPRLGVLATSRRPVGVAGESVWPVPPLAVPPPGAPSAAVAEAPAVRLFLARARDAGVALEVDAGNADDVAALCRVLDGLPLAIELAAARTKVLPVAGILGRLDDRFGLLTGGPSRDARQRSLRAAIDWSHDLLEPDERAYFARLGAFGGRFRFDAATHVAADGLAADPLDLLTAMVDRSLVVVDGDDSYRMLDSLRAYAGDRLRADPAEHDAAMARLARWVAGRCDAEGARLRGPGQIDALGWLRPEQPNIRAALAWCLDGGDPSLGARLARSLVWFWVLEGATEEAVRWLRRSVDHAPDEAVRAGLLEGLGVHAIVAGDVHQAEACLAAAVDAWAGSGDPHEGVVAVIYLGVVRRWLAGEEAGRALLDRAAALAAEAGDDWGRSWALVWRARAEIEAGDPRAADPLLHEAAALAERAGDGRVLARVGVELANAALAAGDAERALTLAERAVAAHEPVGPNPGQIGAVNTVGRALVALGRAKEAVEHHRRALRIATELGHRHAAMEVLEAAAPALAAAGRPDAAAELLGAAAAARARAGLDGAPPPTELDRLAVDLRDPLGDDRFAAAYTAGIRRSASDAVRTLTV